MNTTDLPLPKHADEEPKHVCEEPKHAGEGPVLVRPTLRNVLVNLPLTLSAVAFMTLSSINFMPSAGVIPAPAEVVIILCVPALIASAFAKDVYRVLIRKATIYTAIVSAIISIALLCLFISVYTNANGERPQSSAFYMLCGLLWLLSTFFCTFLINWMLVRGDEAQEELCAKILKGKALRITIKCCLVLAVCMSLLFAFDNWIWFDESFTLRLIALDYTDLIDITAHDVHPPLYYILLKLWVDTLSFGSKNIELTIFLSRLFSLLAYALTAILCYVKLSGSRVASWRHMLLLCLFALQGVLYYGLEIRMYSWSLLFVTATYLFMIDIINGNKNWKVWTAVTFFSVCAAYTHNYALISVAILWLLLLCWLIGRDKKLFVRWLMCGIVVAALYLPWFPVLLNQTGHFGESHNTIITAKSFANVYIWLLSPVHTLVPFLLITALRNNRIKCSSFAYIIGLLVPIGTILAGTIMSLTIHSLFVPRYIIPTDICLWVFIFFIYTRAKEKDKLLLVLCLLLSLFISICTRVTRVENHRVHTCATRKYVSKITSPGSYGDNKAAQKGVLFVAPGGKETFHDVYVMWCATSNEIVIPYHPGHLDNERGKKMFPNITSFDNAKDMWSYINTSGKTVYSVERFPQEDDNILTPDNYSREFVGEHILEGPCYFYKLTPKTDTNFSGGE